MKNCWRYTNIPIAGSVEPRRLLQERAASRDLDENVVKSARRMLLVEEDEAAALAALWMLHVTGNLETDDYNQALSNSSDIVRLGAFNWRPNEHSSRGFWRKHGEARRHRQIGFVRLALPPHFQCFHRKRGGTSLNRLHPIQRMPTIVFCPN